MRLWFARRPNSCSPGGPDSPPGSVLSATNSRGPQVALLGLLAVDGTLTRRHRAAARTANSQGSEIKPTCARFGHMDRHPHVAAHRRSWSPRCRLWDRRGCGCSLNHRCRFRDEPPFVESRWFARVVQRWPLRQDKAVLLHLVEASIRPVAVAAIPNLADMMPAPVSQQAQDPIM